jgi:hypothetical protein
MGEMEAWEEVIAFIHEPVDAFNITTP